LESVTPSGIHNNRRNYVLTVPLSVLRSYRADYKIGVDNNGKANAIQLMLYCNKVGGSFRKSPKPFLFLKKSRFVCLQGAAIDFASPVEPAFMAIDNCYNFVNFAIDAKVCKTNIPPNTSTRGPGWLQAIFIMEHVMEHVAAYLGLPADQIKVHNAHPSHDNTPLPLIIITSDTYFFFDRA
jgi:xanthine dehydrogenase molybdopterin-binding subunit B